MFQELGTILKTGLNQKWNLLADIIEHLSGKIVFRHRCMKMLKNMLPASYISPFPSSVLLCVIFILKHVLLATLSISWLICSLPRKLCKMRLSLFNCSFSLYPLFGHISHIGHAVCLIYSAQELNHSVFWRNKSQVSSIMRQRYFLVIWSG